MYFKLFKDLSDEKIDFDTVRQSLFWFGPLSILLAIFGPALAYVGNSWLLDLTGAISPWTSNQIMDFAQLGITQYILHGWPKWDEMRRFGTEVLPRVRRNERRTAC